MALKKFLFCFLTFSTQFVGNQNWETTQFIWNFGLVSRFDVGVPKDPWQYFSNEPNFDPLSYQTIKSGDIVWVPSRFVVEFYEKIFPFIQVPFVLVVSSGDASFPSDILKPKILDELISEKNIIHIFAQNCDYQGSSKKISHIPIGIDFHTVGYNGAQGGWGMVGSPLEQEAVLLNLIQKALPTNMRKCRAYVDFQHSDTMHADFRRYLQHGEDRASIFKTLLSSGVIDHGKWVPREELWNTKIDYAFSISPHGNGLDCHRTWEDLALGCIVIVKSSPLDPLYEGLPVVIIKDWNEINEENFKKWIIKYGDASTNATYRKKLTNQYWITKIINASKFYKTSL